MAGTRTRCRLGGGLGGRHGDSQRLHPHHPGFASGYQEPVAQLPSAVNHRILPSSCREWVLPLSYFRDKEWVWDSLSHT